MHTFNEALKLCKANQKIIWGTKTEMFHLIDKNDRDFDTNFATSKNICQNQVKLFSLIEAGTIGQ